MLQSPVIQSDSRRCQSWPLDSARRLNFVAASFALTAGDIHVSGILSNIVFSKPRSIFGTLCPKVRGLLAHAPQQLLRVHVIAGVVDEEEQAAVLRGRRRVVRIGASGGIIAGR